MVKERYMTLIQVCKSNKGCKYEFQDFQRKEGYTQEFKCLAKYEMIVSAEIKLLVYKQDYMQDGYLPPLYTYHKPPYYGQLYDDLFSTQCIW